MNPFIKNDVITHDSQYLKVFLRVFIERIRRNRDDVPDVYMSDLLNKLDSSTNNLEEEANAQNSRNTTLSTPEEVKVNLKITINECENKSKANDIKDDYLDTHGAEGKERTYSNDEKINDNPTTNVEENSVHQDSFEGKKKSEAYSFRATVPPRWYSTLKSETPVSYGWKVASLVRHFESLPKESGAQDKKLVGNLPRKCSDADQQSSVVTDAIQDVCVGSKPTTSADEEDSKASTRESTSRQKATSSVVEASAFDLHVFAKKIQRPEHDCISGVPCLSMLSYQNALNANRISPGADSQVPLVVQDLVMDKYEDNWSRSTQRKIRRESLRKSLTIHSCSEEDFIPEYSEIKDNGLLQDISEGKFNKASSDSGLSHSDAAESSKNSVKSGEAINSLYGSSGYDQQILMEEKAKSIADIGNKSDEGDKDGPYYAIPERSCESLMPEQVSIGSSNLSCLLSSCPVRRSRTLSYYSAVSNRTRKLLPIPSKTNVGYYESVPNKVNKLLKEKYIQLEITNQVSKAVLICRRQRKVIRQDIQVEAEKILLVATRRRDIIDEELNKCSDTLKEMPPISISVSMKNFNFSRVTLMPGKKYSKKYSWFFVLVLEAGTTVLASEVVKGDNEILFQDHFRFEGKSRDVPINVKLFSLVLKNHKKKKNCQKSITGPNPSPDYAPTHSFFNLWGSCELRPSRLSKPGTNWFRLTQIPPEASLSDMFSAETEMYLKVMVFKRGFLTVGIEDPNRLPVWNRRWCVLDGTNLKYWNYPNEEEVSKPVGQLDLVTARSHEVRLVSKELCPWPKCLSLEIKLSESDTREYFFSADTLEEFHEWKVQLNLVLGYLSKWRRSQEDVECGK